MSDLNILQEVSKNANRHYWEVHALLMSAKLMVEKLDENEECVVEIGSLLNMASIKALDMQGCFNKYIPLKSDAQPEVSHG